MQSRNTRTTENTKQINTNGRPTHMNNRAENESQKGISKAAKGTEPPKHQGPVMLTAEAM